ncbi:OmpA family protein [Polaribacter glomeratus]|uniref:Cell envelope biogenesis protein OmpA n=1 Tax=Polaribacter glomeratus TaxID=102 RepID=A0A2S7WIJ6_9FLAO|nr:OmpA family protein [Polaribacter glomeratus]PQJ77420.1 cell envelope biogenesis protein OmpA [Polaribacter glomeratus]TXD66006.1 OmpA family protein [Polaribacter glomeratus]
MKKIFLGALICCFTISVNAQEYNKWSLDIGAGVTEIINPLSPGYKTDALSLGQASLGVRYMFNEKFGLRLDVGYNEFKEGKNSLPFKSNYYRTSLEGVVNAGNVLNFSSWTSRFNLLFHGGLGMSNLRTITPIDNGTGEPILNMIVGFTPQFKLSNRISLFLDASAIFHDYQDFTFDGAANTRAREINASIFNTSIGVNISLGKQKQNADFLQNEDVTIINDLEDIKTRLNTAENVLAGLMVKNSDTDNTKLMTELDTRYVRKGEENKYANTITSSNVDFIRELLNSGYINVYFNTNETTIQQGSLNSVNYLKQFMNDNPSVNALLIGYADETGNEDKNLQLSENRAKSVFEVLVAAGIDPNRLSFSGGGEDTSVTTKARQFARKVTFKIK